MLPRLIACDLDGTLLRSDGTLDARTAATLHEVRRAGATVVICTARPVRWVQGLEEVSGVGNLAVCANGAVVWDLGAERALAIKAIPPLVAGEVVGRIETALPGGHWAVEREDGFGREPGYLTRWPVPPGALEADVCELIARPVLKLLFRLETMLADALLARARELLGDLVALSHSNAKDSLLEIAASGVSKAAALADVCEGLGITAEEVIAFGGMPNDLPMLHWAGRAVAVANAHPDVLAAADEVTASNDDGGVSRVLERLLISRGPAASDRRRAS